MAISLALGLGAYLVICVLLLGPEQPAAVQRLLALVFVASSVGVYVAVTRQPELPDETLLRLRRGRHADFGKQLRAKQRARRTITLPGIGQTSYRFWGGVGVFLVTAAWWLTPLAPVRVKQRELQDITVPLGQAIAAAELVMLDGHTAVCLPPVVPERAKELARFIPDRAGACQRALRAIAEGRFIEAENLLMAAANEGGISPEQLALARAQAFMYGGRFLDAVTEYKKVLAQTPDNVLILCQAAIACMQSGDMAQAEPLVARAVERTAQPASGEDSDRGFSLHAQALLNLGQGRRYDAAEEQFKQSRDLWEVALPENQLLASVSRNNQAIVYLLRARYSAARELIDWSREGRRNPVGAASVLGNLGMLLYVQGDLRGARTQAESARAAIADGTLAVPLPVAAVNHGQLALLEWAQGNYEAGRKRGEAALLQCSESVGAEHPLSAPILVTLATLYRDRSLFAKAEPYYFRALSITRRAHGEQHPYVAAILVRLAGLHLARKNHREAELVISQATEVLEKTFGEEHPALAEALNARGELELEMGRTRDARRPLEKALKIIEGTYSRSHPLAVRVLGNLGAIENSPRTYKRGVGLYEEALAAAEASLGPEHPELARLEFGLATLYISQAEYGQAQPVAERCLTLREKILPPFHPDLASACELVATVLENLPKPQTERATELRARAKSIRQRHVQEDRADAP
ncbi:MAG: tetratricopeptide repeat protein [Thermoguttaceae bacterium]|nr:tetratricopeptide repeat protein [Thermoguttaceae bacterium]